MNTNKHIDETITKLYLQGSKEHALQMFRSAPKFSQTFCSQCGQAFGPGDYGFSHCFNHSHLKAVDD